MGLITLLSGNRSENLFLPAHGRGNALPKNLRNLLKLKPGIWDLPELFEIGGPLIAEGAIAESQRFSASKVGVIIPVEFILPSANIVAATPA